MSDWKAAKAPDGRTYYYRGSETTWDKPADFVEGGAPAPAPAPAPAAAAGDWREVLTAEGKPYYYNNVTRETTWVRPPGFVHQPQNAGQLVAGGPQSQSFGHDDRGQSDRRMDRRGGDRDHNLPQKPSFDGGRGGNMPWERQDHGGFRGAAPAKTDEPEYATIEQAEEAFFNLLRKHKITPDTKWEDALREVIKERDYRALRDPKERRAAFEKYCADVRAQEKGKEKERRAKLRQDYLDMLATHEEIKHYTRWKTARPIIEREVVFRNAQDEDERRQLFDEYILDLKKKHAEAEIEQQRAAGSQLTYVLQTNVKDPDAKWDDVKEMLLEQPGVNKLEAIHAFEHHVKSLERDTNEAKQFDKRTQFRSYRQARDDFRGLLHSLRSQGKIKAGSTWTEIHPLIHKDERYINLVGNPGSSPLDLFWDIVEEEERKIRSLRHEVMDVLADLRFEVQLTTPLEEFMHAMRSDPRTAKVPDQQLEIVFTQVIAKVQARIDAEKKSKERNQDLAVDGLRSAIKHLSPAVRLDDSFEDVMARVSTAPEYADLDEEGRLTAYKKHMRRLKEREEDSYRDRHRDSHRDRDRNGSRRDRDRDDRRHRTRSPEGDIYEADRKKAQADRERQFRKSSWGLSPPPGRDRRDDRDDRYRRHDRHESMSVYDRERREREEERERSYTSRAGPRDRGKTLDYGDEDAVGSRPGSIRKRGDSEASGSVKRDVKRPRRADEDEKKKDDDEAPELQSGSEEGEIEEL